MPNTNRGSTGFQSAEFEEEYEKPSKSQRKRDMIALQKLGEQLVDASADRLRRVVLPDNLRTAIDEYRKIRSHEGRRRQLQFIGKIMRGLDDPDIATITKTIESWQGQSKSEVAALHIIERQREKLLSDDAALTELLSRYPQIDVQHLRSLIRKARKEQAESKPPKAYREIFKILKQLQDMISDTPKQIEEEKDE